MYGKGTEYCRVEDQKKDTQTDEDESSEIAEGEKRDQKFTTLKSSKQEPGEEKRTTRKGGPLK